MNVKMAPTYFEDFDFSFEDDFEDFGTKLSEEFRKSRNLLPIRVIIDGPPLIGKTTLAKCIADYYHLHYFETEKIVGTYMNKLLNEAEETKAFLNLLEAERKDKDDTDDQGVKDDMMDMEDRLKEMLQEWTTELEEINAVVEVIKASKGDDFELKKRCLLKIILSKACNENQGYVLDGFPFAYEKAAEIFPRLNAGGEEGGEGEEEELGEVGLKPDYVILLDADDELLCRRARDLSEEVACATKSTEDEMLERLEEYRERNQEDRSLISFFYDIDIIPLTFCINQHTKCDEIFEKIKDEIGLPHVYPISKAERDAMKRWKEEMNIKHEMELKRIREEAIANEREQREANLQKWTKEFERLKCKEQEFMEAKTLPLRQYLGKFVLPPLTEGLLKVAEQKPEDPVDFLAEHLFQYNPHGHVLSPSYSEEIKKLLLDEGDEDIAKTLDMMAENESEFACNRKINKEKHAGNTSTRSSSEMSEYTREIRETNIIKVLREFGGLKPE